MSDLATRSVDVPPPGISPPLRIEVVAAVGRGQTPISSFDRALWACGTHNYNLIQLSSIIPPRAEVVEVERCARPPDEFGHRLCVVKAEARSVEPGAVVAAGIGWVQWGDGRGCFVEHELTAVGGSCQEAEGAVREHLYAALLDLCATREIEFDRAQVRSRVVTGRVEWRATTALALAVYQAEGWR